MNHLIEGRAIVDDSTKVATRELIKDIRDLKALVDHRVSDYSFNTPGHYVLIREEATADFRTIELRRWKMHNAVHLTDSTPSGLGTLKRLDYTDRTFRDISVPDHQPARFIVREPIHNIVQAGNGVFILAEDEMVFTGIRGDGAMSFEQHGGYRVICARYGDFAGGMKIDFTEDFLRRSAIKPRSIEYFDSEDENFNTNDDGIHTQMERIAYGYLFLENARRLLNSEYPEHTKLVLAHK